MTLHRKVNKVYKESKQVMYQCILGHTFEQQILYITTNYCHYSGGREIGKY